MPKRVAPRPIDLDDLREAPHAAEADRVAGPDSIDRTRHVSDLLDAANPLGHPIEVRPKVEDDLEGRLDVGGECVAGHESYGTPGQETIDGRTSGGLLCHAW